MADVKFLVGERVYLRPLLDRDAAGSYPFWLNDHDVCQGTSHHIYPYSRENALEYIVQSHDVQKALVLAMVLRENDKHIGNIALQRLNWIYRTAEFAILLGDKTEWGKGYALEAARLLIKHGFTALNLNRIECATFDNNEGMKKLALTLGMKQEGVRREAAYKNGEFLDIVEFGVLRDEMFKA